ncbi:hypothetical protein DVH24_015376 [Malus domestica]|uniref:Uncharacterized protein n=1 Tax=Malus domestica TaxID=3750 RepID=A0A498K3N3_MALDO|nr:hypothetical protein DVH24_015376 [Malus domestica]
MESEASEFPKGLMLYGGGHVHIRHITPSSLVHVECYNSPPFGVRRPRWHTCTTWQSGSDTIMSHPSLDFAIARYCPVSASATHSKIALARTR